MIPPFNGAGLLPPYVGTNPAVPHGLSPYRSDPLELVQRFATTAQRIALLHGLLNWRQALSGLGITGLQWIDGSFCEDVERVAGRAPADIDVVSFIIRPVGVQQQAAWAAFVQANQAMLLPQPVKQQFGCDAYMVDVMAGPGTMLDQTTYWFGLFSHKRVTMDWKGIIALPMPANDVAAVAALNAIPAPPP